MYMSAVGLTDSLGTNSQSADCATTAFKVQFSKRSLAIATSKLNSFRASVYFIASVCMIRWLLGHAHVSETIVSRPYRILL
eukprot:CFRG0812T1